jgi:hypothetical protein
MAPPGGASEFMDWFAENDGTLATEVMRERDMGPMMLIDCDIFLVVTC